MVRGIPAAASAALCITGDKRVRHRMTRSTTAQEVSRCGYSLQDFLQLVLELHRPWPGNPRDSHRMGQRSSAPSTWSTVTGEKMDVCVRLHLSHFRQMCR